MRNLVKGDTFYEMAGCNVYKYHVIETFEDKNGGLMVIFKYYGKHKRWWHFRVKKMRDIKTWFDSAFYAFKKEDLKVYKIRKGV